MSWVLATLSEQEELHMPPSPLSVSEQQPQTGRVITAISIKQPEVPSHTHVDVLPKSKVHRVFMKFYTPFCLHKVLHSPIDLGLLQHLNGQVEAAERNYAW